MSPLSVRWCSVWRAPARVCRSLILVKLAVTLLLLGAGLALSGCVTPYMIRQAAGQVDILARAVPVAEAQQDPDLDPGLKTALDDVDSILAFAKKNRLDVGNTYQTFVNFHGKAPVYVLYGSPPDRLQTRVWHFPLIGAFPYKGFFDLAAARRQRRLLEEEGLETMILPAPAYSTLGWFPDPLFSSFLEQSVGVRAEVLFHELTHRTLFIRDAVRFNENLADFVGGELARQYLEATERHEELEHYLGTIHDRELFRVVVAETREALEEAFEQEDREARLQSREQIFARATELLEEAEFRTAGYRGWRRVKWSIPLLLSFDLYRGEQDLLGEAYRAWGSDMPKFLERLSGLRGEDDPVATLRSWLANSSG